MNISSISGATNVAATAPVRSSRTSSIPPAPNAGPATTASISKQGDLMGKLQQLAAQDPAKFKEVAKQLSETLKSAAGSATGDAAKALSKLSEALGQAAQSGDLSALQSGGGAKKHHGGHGHHPGGGAGGGPPPAIQAALSSALDTVNKALGVSAPSSTAASPPAAAGA